MGDTAVTIMSNGAQIVFNNQHDTHIDALITLLLANPKIHQNRKIELAVKSGTGGG